MMTVHEVSRLTGVSIRTLQYYDSIGLLVDRFFPVKVRAFDDLPDLLQREFQFPEQKDLLQGFQGCIVIQPVARLGIF